jgi:hypothetical protein
MGRGEPIVLPPNSSYLVPLGFQFWGYAEDKV